MDFFPFINGHIKQNDIITNQCIINRYKCKCIDQTNAKLETFTLDVLIMILKRGSEWCLKFSVHLRFLTKEISS